MNWPGSRADEMVSTESEGKRRRRWPFAVAGVVLVVALGAGLYVWAQVRDLTSAKYNVINYSVPSSPHLVAGQGETVYRIDPTQSKLTYGVDEKLFGQDAQHAEGSTNGIAGDLAVNTANPGASRVGEIVVNVEQLHSDNNLRDARMRQRASTRTTTRSRTSPSRTSPGMPATIVDRHAVPLQARQPAHRQEGAGARDLERRRPPSTTASSPRRPRPRSRCRRSASARSASPGSSAPPTT